MRWCKNSSILGSTEILFHRLIKSEIFFLSFRSSSIYSSLKADFLIKKREIRESRREGDLDKATTLIEDEIIKNLPGPRSSLFNSAQEIAERITGRDSHHHVNIQYSVPSDILNQKYDSIFSINGRQRNLPLEPQKEDKLKNLKILLWDRNTTWDVEAINSSDITNIEMCYATLKRLRTLLSSLKCTLEEIEALKP